MHILVHFLKCGFLYQYGFIFQSPWSPGSLFRWLPNLCHQPIFILWATDINVHLPTWCLSSKLYMPRMISWSSIKIWLFPVFPIYLVCDYIRHPPFPHLSISNISKLISCLKYILSMFTSLYHHCHNPSSRHYHISPGLS